MAHHLILAFFPRERVQIKELCDQEGATIGRVTSVRIFSSDGPIYAVEWWREGKRETSDFYEDELASVDT